MRIQPFFLRSMSVCVFLFSFFLLFLGSQTISVVHADTTTRLTDINMFEGIGRANVRGDPREIVKGIINVAMGFLGMLAVLTILFGGFKWMTAGGSKENTEKATKLLTNGVIGLIIIFSAWTLAQFILYVLKQSVQAV